MIFTCIQCVSISTTLEHGTDRHIAYYYNDSIYILFGQYYLPGTTTGALHDSYWIFNPETLGYICLYYMCIF